MRRGISQRQARVSRRAVSGDVPAPRVKQRTCRQPQTGLSGCVQREGLAPPHVWSDGFPSTCRSTTQEYLDDRAIISADRLTADPDELLDLSEPSSIPESQ